MAKKKKWEYTWGSWEAFITESPRIKNRYRWSVHDINGNDTYDMYSHIDVDLNTPLEAENDMFYTINDRIGHEPKRQIKQ